MEADVTSCTIVEFYWCKNCMRGPFCDASRERERERERDGASPSVNRPVCKECNLTPAAVGQIWFEAEAVVP